MFNAKFSSILTISWRAFYKKTSGKIQMQIHF